MKNVGRRIEQTRVDPATYKMQADIVARLDALIRELERQPPDDLPVPTPPPPPPPPPGRPMDEPRIANNPGPGDVIDRNLPGLARAWGKLPDRERARAIQELTRELPPQYREIIDSYFRALARAQTSRSR
jgi:hypothetical protein